MSHIFRVYQIAFDGSDIAKSREKVSGVDFTVFELSPLDESIELHDGLFKLGDISVVLDGLPEHYFKAFVEDDDGFAPFVFEIREGTNQAAWLTSPVVFHGMIDPSSVQFSIKSGRTSFDVLSWDYILRTAGDVPARSVFDTYITHVISADEFARNAVPMIYVPALTEIFPGDILEIETEQGPQRGTVLLVGSTPEEWGKGVVALLPSRRYYVEKGTGLKVPYLVPQEATWDNLFTHNLFKATLPASYEFLVGANLLGKRLCLLNEYDQPLTTLRPYRASYGNDGEVIIEVWANADAIKIIDAEWTPDKTYKFDIYDDIIVEPKAKAKVIGGEVYGYDTPTKRDHHEILNVDGGTPSGIIPAIMSLPGGRFDILRSLVNAYELAGDPGTIDREMDYPENILESLREIQRTSMTYLRFIPSTTASGLPRLTLRLQTREHAANEQIVLDANMVVTEWSELTVDSPYRAVVVTTHDIEKPESYGEVCGWYPSNLSAKPEGDRILNLKTLRRPAYLGRGYHSSEGFVANDANLQQIAKAYFTFFSDLGSEGTAVIPDVVPGLVGRKLNFDVPYTNEGGVTTDRTVLITGSKIDLANRKTEITFRRGTYIPSAGSFVLAVPSVLPVVYDINGDGSESVFFDGSRSIAPTDATYEWSLLNGPTTGVIGSTRNLIKVLPNGSYVGRLTVTAGGQSDSQDFRFTITDKYFADGRASSYDYVTEEIEVLEEGELVRYGRVKLRFLGDGQLPILVEFRKASGRNFFAIDDMWIEEPVHTIEQEAGFDLTVYTATVRLVEKHFSLIEARFAFPNGQRVLLPRFTFDADKVPNVSYGVNFAWDDENEGFDVQFTWNGDVDTAGVVSRLQYLTEDITLEHIGRVGSSVANVGTDVVPPNTQITITFTGYSKYENGVLGGIPQADPPTYVLRTPERDSGVGGPYLEIGPTGRLVTNFPPPAEGAGLYLQDDHLGFFGPTKDLAGNPTGVNDWLTYMDYTGNFFLVGRGAYPGENYVSWNGETLAIKGQIYVTGGDAATKAYADNAATNVYNNAVDYVDHYAPILRPGDAGRDVIDHNAPIDGSSGLFIGGNAFGYHNGSRWVTYMNNQGDFFLGHPNYETNYLSYDASTGTLALKGTFYITGGDAATKGYADTKAAEAEANAKNASVPKGGAHDDIFQYQAPVSGSGLFIGYNALGFYDSGYGWRTYFDNNGNFYAGKGRTQYIQYANGTLTLRGNLYFPSGTQPVDAPTAQGYANTAETNAKNAAYQYAQDAAYEAEWNARNASIPTGRAHRDIFGYDPGAQPGLNINSTRIGYYNAGWRTYISNTGAFFFGSSAANFLSWNGSLLTLRGDMKIVGGTIEGGMTFDGGNIVAGGGDVIIDENGITIRGASPTTDYNNALRFYNAPTGSNIAGEIFGTQRSDVGVSLNTIVIRAGTGLTSGNGCVTFLTNDVVFNTNRITWKIGSGWPTYIPIGGAQIFSQGNELYYRVRPAPGTTTTTYKITKTLA